MIFESFAVGVLGCNCCILGDETSREALVVDPGDEAERIIARLAALELRLVGILHTHAHIDHVGGTLALSRATHAPTYLHDADRFLHDMLPVQARMIGLPLPEHAPMDRPLPDETSIPFGAHEVGVLHTPGHTPGSVCLVIPHAELCLSGDTLFASGIGRTDLWGGDLGAIERSIRERLYVLSGSIEVVPGHGPTTPIDIERRTNPFVRG